MRAPRACERQGRFSVPAFSRVAAADGVVTLPPPRAFPRLDPRRTAAPTTTTWSTRWLRRCGRDALHVLTSSPPCTRLRRRASSSAGQRLRILQDFRHRIPAWDALYRFALYGQLTPPVPACPDRSASAAVMRRTSVGSGDAAAAVARRTAMRRCSDGDDIAFIIATVVYLVLVATALHRIGSLHGRAVPVHSRRRRAAATTARCAKPHGRRFWRPTLPRIPPVVPCAGFMSTGRSPKSQVEERRKRSALRYFSVFRSLKVSRLGLEPRTL